MMADAQVDPYDVVGFVKLKETQMTNAPTPEELIQLREAADLAGVLPQVTGEVDKMINQLMAKVDHDITKGILTPERAMSYWLELHSYRRLNKRLTDKAIMANQITDTRRA